MKVQSLPGLQRNFKAAPARLLVRLCLIKRNMEKSWGRWHSRGSGLAEHLAKRWVESSVPQKKERKREGRRKEAERDLCVHVVVFECNGNTQALRKEGKERAGTSHDCWST